MSVSSPVSFPEEHSRTHVLFVIDQLCESGGAERMLLNTIRLLPPERYRCSLITFKIDASLELFRNLPCPHQVFPLRKTYDWNALQTALKLREFIETENVQIVHTFHETSDLWAGVISKLGRHRPALVSSRRDMGILRSPKHRVGYRMLSSLFDLVLTVSEKVRVFCIQQDHLSPEKVVTLYNGLELENIPDAAERRNLREALHVDPAVPIIVTVGHIRQVKGIDVLVETAAKVTRKFPNVLFLVIGRNCDPGHFQSIDARISELGIQKNVLFMGESEKILSLIQACDVFFLPSRSEGFSNALIEAMACCLPCVATRVGGNDEAVQEGSSGYIVENEDAQAAAEALETLLREPLKAKAMGAAGRRIVEQRFTASVMIHKLMECYGGLLKPREK
jgi:glycosyltransferase involved in cell wall biosynthesis